MFFRNNAPPLTVYFNTCNIAEFYFLWIHLFFSTTFTYMKLRKATRLSTMMTGQVRLLITLSPLNFLWWLIMIMDKIEFSAWSPSDYLMLLPILYELGRSLFMLTLNLLIPWNGLLYVILVSKSTLVSLLSFGVMFTLTSYLVVLTLRLNRKRVRSRVNSRNWTRRRVFWLQKGKRRSMYLLNARENSIKARPQREKKARAKTRELLGSRFSFIAACLNCVKARGKVCCIQTTSFLGSMFSFIGASLKLCETALFWKDVFPYCGMLELGESLRQSMSYPNNLFFYKIYFSIYLPLWKINFHIKKAFAQFLEAMMPSFGLNTARQEAFQRLLRVSDMKYSLSVHIPIF